VTQPEPKTEDTVAVDHNGQPVSPSGATATQLAHRRTGAVASPLASTDPMLAMMAMMERIAKNKEVDVEKMREVKELGMSLLNDQRRTAFDDALTQMQDELPVITARGKLEIREKGTGKLIQSTPYAKWEDINQVIKPVLKKYGFVLRFKTGLTEDGRVLVTGILAGHGHREESSFSLPHDSTGSKNAVQAIGSSTSYGKRYAAGALLNITSRGEDDDGKKGGGKPLDEGDFPGDKPNLITSDQITQLRNLCKRVGCPEKKFTDWADVDRIEDITAERFDGCVAGLNNFRKS
jgi:ERF superfamily